MQKKEESQKNHSCYCLPKSVFWMERVEQYIKGGRHREGGRIAMKPNSLSQPGVFVRTARCL